MQVNSRILLLKMYQVARIFVHSYFFFKNGSWSLAGMLAAVPGLLTLQRMDSLELLPNYSFYEFWCRAGPGPCGPKKLQPWFCGWQYLIITSILGWECHTKGNAANFALCIPQQVEPKSLILCAFQAWRCPPKTKEMRSLYVFPSLGIA